MRGGGRGGGGVGGYHHRLPHRRVRRTNTRLCSNPACMFCNHRDQQGRTCTGTPYSCGIAAWLCSRGHSPRRSPSCLPGRHVQCLPGRHVPCFPGPPPWQAGKVGTMVGLQSAPYLEPQNFWNILVKLCGSKYLQSGFPASCLRFPRSGFS